MKSMNDRGIGMSNGKPKSEGFFPQDSKVKVMAKPGAIKNKSYPDKEQDILSAQNEHVKKISGNAPKQGFRH